MAFFIAENISMNLDIHDEVIFYQFPNQQKIDKICYDFFVLYCNYALCQVG